MATARVEGGSLRVGAHTHIVKENAIVTRKTVGPVHVQIQKSAHRKPRLQIPPRLAQPLRFFCQQSPKTSSSLPVRGRRRTDFFSLLPVAPVAGCAGFFAPASVVFDAVFDAARFFTITQQSEFQAKLRKRVGLSSLLDS
jgi:hypothetical protein